MAVLLPATIIKPAASSAARVLRELCFKFRLPSLRGGWLRGYSPEADGPA
jgi:hypothetical protein